MPILFSCECGQSLQAREEHSGRRVRCPRCGVERLVPTGSMDEQTAVQASDDPTHLEIRQEKKTAAPPANPALKRRVRQEIEDDDDEDYPRPRRPKSGRSGKAIVALLLSLLSLCILPGILGIVFGVLSLKDCAASRGRLKGRGMAITAIVFSILGLVSAIPLGISALLLPATMKVRQAAERMHDANHLKQIALAFHNHNDAEGALLQDACLRDPAGKPLLSWRVALLPYIEHEGLYRQFRLTEPWDSPHNKALIPLMPQVFEHGNNPAERSQGLTHFRLFTGPKTAFPPGKRLKFVDFSDGLSNTLMIVTTEEAVIWTKPDDLSYDPAKPLPLLSKKFQGSSNVAYWDGSVNLLSPKVSEPTMRALITANGNDAVGPDFQP